LHVVASGFVPVDGVGRLASASLDLLLQHSEISPNAKAAFGAVGAAGLPLRIAFGANLAMFTHMLPTVYFGAAAVHMTRLAGTGHEHWETEGVLLMLGLGVCVAPTLLVTR
jgi:hypothetical protein